MHPTAQPRADELAPPAVPLVDLRAPGAAAELTSALREVSCAFVVGHGVDLGGRLAVRELSRRFFAPAAERKAPVRWDGTGLWGGWQPVYEGAADLTADRVPELVERFEVRDPATWSLWPDEPAGFAEAWTAYHGQCAALASRLTTMVAGELDLPTGDLAPWTDQQYANLVVNHYPAQPDLPLEGQVRVGGHTDRGGFTLLWADDAPGGLEMKPTGRNVWVPVAFPPDVFLVQVGDLLSRWTNGVIRANVHRVVNPPREVAATAQRLALVYFHYPALDTVVAPAPSCVGTGRALPALVAGDHILARQRQYTAVGDELVVAG